MKFNYANNIVKIIQMFVYFVQIQITILIWITHVILEMILRIAFLIPKINYYASNVITDML